MTEPPLSDSEIRTLRTMIDRHVREAENRYYQEQFETISSQRHGCLTCFDSDCAVWQTADQNCWKSEKDAIKKERERVSILTPDDRILLYPMLNRVVTGTRIPPSINEPHVIELLEKLKKTKSLRSEA